MIWPPREIPNIDPKILEAAENGKLIIFVGAGVSRLLGYPSWDGFANDILTDLARKNKITFGEKALLQEYDPKKKLTIATQIAEEKELHKKYAEIFKKKSSTASKIYDYLKEIEPVFVTTNYDAELDDNTITTKPSTSESSTSTTTKTPLICEPKDFLEVHLRKPPRTIHLHGSVSKPSTMVVTTDDYLKHYSGNTETVKFLEDLFKSYTVLFVGYGLDELEILEYALFKGAAEKTKANKRFMLQGFYSYQQQTCAHLSTYYQKFGVDLIPFSLDYEEFNQLENILKDWKDKINVIGPSDSSDLSFLTGVLEDE